MASIARDQNRLRVDNYAGSQYHLIGLALRGEKSPCMATTSDAWISDNPAEKQAAVEACQYCPAIRECYEFGRATRTEFGIYGGHDFSHGPRQIGRAHV